MTATFLTLGLLSLAFLLSGLKSRLEELERAQRFERRMHMEAQLDKRLRERRMLREVRSERARKGWQTRRAG